MADLICVYDEEITIDTYEIFDPECTWKRKTLTNYYVEELQVPIFKNGKLVYNIPTIEESRAYCKRQINRLWEEVKRFDNPHGYYVDLSQKLWDIKHKIILNKKH